METAETTSSGRPEARAEETTQVIAAPSNNGAPNGVEPDLEFIQALSRQSGDNFLKCFQCGTCSAVCALSPDTAPFPRKEMAWARWGLKDRLVKDPDAWLCYQCHDCSTRCPRGARPGDVLAAVRQQSISYHAFPRFLGRWANEIHYAPLLLGLSVALLTLALVLKDRIAEALGITTEVGQRIVYSYSSVFPHWLLNGIFLGIGFLVLLAIIIGVARFWRSLKTGSAREGADTPVKGLLPSIVAALKSVITHDNFTNCSRERQRYISHMCVFFGFLALCPVTLWIITAGINPLLQKDFVYPFSFWSPWKLLANAGGLALLFGLSLMMRNRLRNSDQTGAGSFFDWDLIATLFVVVLTGFITETLHYLRLEPHRHIAYFVHLVFVGALLFYLPYSKLAHLFYRTTAMVYAEYTGRNAGVKPAPRAAVENMEENHAG